MDRCVSRGEVVTEEETEVGLDGACVAEAVLVRAAKTFRPREDLVPLMMELVFAVLIPRADSVREDFLCQRESRASSVSCFGERILLG